MKLVIITWAAFFLRQKPVSTSANPACMNIPRKPATSVQVKLMAILFLPAASLTGVAWSTPMSDEAPVTSPQGSPAAAPEATFPPTGGGAAGQPSIWAEPRGPCQQASRAAGPEAPFPPQGGGLSWAWAAPAHRPSNA